ncbi:hypothetical protein J6590_064053 [Homalodisca vitripennis]|nr:hypothetical protein J6590_064053 [Homalodisca vitripennis]
MTGIKFEERKFKSYLHKFYVVLSILHILYCTAILAKSFQEGGDLYQNTIQELISIYIFGLVVHWKSVQSDVMQLIHSLREGLHNYCSFTWSCEVENELIKIKKAISFSEKIVLGNNLKGILACFVFPLLTMLIKDGSNKAEIRIVDSPLEILLATHNLMKPIILPFMTVTLCSFHSSWEVVLIDCVSCLKGELRILADSIVNIDQRAQDMSLSLIRDMRASRWSSAIRPLHSSRGSKPSARTDRNYEKLKEICTMECIKENIRHHQAIIRQASLINKVVCPSIFMYGKLNAFTLAVFVFSIAQLRIRRTFDTWYRSVDIKHALYACNWTRYSPRVVRCVRFMMLRANKPLRLRTVFYPVNMATFVEV